MKKEILPDDLPPFLQDLKRKGDGLQVPEGYFDDMEAAVFARLRSAGDLDRPALTVVKKPGLFVQFLRPRAAMAYAAALALVLAAVWFVRQSVTSVPEAPLATLELSEDDIEAYVLENVHEFEPEQLASLSKEDLPEITTENPTPSAQPQAVEELHPDDLDQILDEMTDEELEEIL